MKSMDFKKVRTAQQYSKANFFKKITHYLRVFVGVAPLLLMLKDAQSTFVALQFVLPMTQKLINLIME
jgi:hypothetical protein